MSSGAYLWAGARVVIGFVVATVVGSGSYAILTFGPSLVFPFFFFFLLGGSVLAGIVFFPLYLVLLRKSWLKCWQMVGVATLVSIPVFAFLFYGSDSEMVSMGAAGKTFVEDGEITMDGYINLGQRVILAATSVAIGSSVFWLVAQAGRRSIGKLT